MKFMKNYMKYFRPKNHQILQRPDATEHNRRCVGGVAQTQWLGRRCLAGKLSLIYA